MDTSDHSTCPLCRQEKVKIFAVGDCSHPVCHLCSTKMRILCEQTYCAICRQDLPRVYFVSDLAEARPPIDSSRFIPIDETGDCGIFYPVKAEWIRREAEKLLRNFCPFCHSEYETFEILRDHVRQDHRYFYCDLCVEHLNLFPHERKCYTRQDLVRHIRQGDRDDTSFRGHPLCKFCDDHFLDVDHLYKHMRLEHYYCHLCSTDSVYYSTFELLRDHYRNDHFLCEIGQCREAQFTNVFASQMEFRAHQATQHSKSRAEARQLGTIPVEFQSLNVRDRRQQQRETNNRETTNVQSQVDGTSSRDETQREGTATVNVPSIDEFPTLGARSTTPQNPSQRGAWSNDARGINSNTDFPALPNGPANSNNNNQVRGAWRESQQAPPPVVNQNTTTKKTTPAVKTIANGVASVNIREDFPALQAATNSKIPPPVSMISAWSKAKKSSKQAVRTPTKSTQMRMNTNRIINENDEDDEYIRRPMSTLMTSSTPSVSSNITVISSSDVNVTQTNEKATKGKNQSVPKLQDFPALPTSNRAPAVNPVPSGVWGASENNTTTTTTTNSSPQKKKKGNMSKKKFIEEVQSLPPAPSLSSANEFPTLGLSELGRRLIQEDNEPEVSNPIKEEKSSTTTNEQTEEKSITPSKKNKSVKKVNPKESLQAQSEDTIRKVASEPLMTKLSPSARTTVSTKEAPVSSTAPPPPPPGFTAPTAVSTPPGFTSLSSTVAAAAAPPPPPPPPPSFICLPSYSKAKDEFNTKLYALFDGDMDLFSEYDKFCQAFYLNSISTTDFLKFTRELFHEKFEDYLLELIVLIPHIERQNELYSIWKKEFQKKSSASTGNWTKKNLDVKSVSQCQFCQQILFDSDSEEHNSHHPQLNREFPSLPSAAISLGRGRGKKAN